MNSRELLLHGRDADLKAVGAIEDYERLEIRLRFRDVSSWILDLDAAAAGASLLSAVKAGLLVELVGGGFEFSGPVTRRQHVWEVGAEGEEVDTYSIAGVDDTVWLARRLGLPVPSGPPYTSASHDVRTGAAETVLKEYVDANAGPSATADRQVPGLAIETDAAAGATVTGRARFAVLRDLADELALAGGDLGFRVVQPSNTEALEFQVWTPEDRTGTAIFSRDLGSLRRFDHTVQAPTATYLYLLGGGEGVDRTVVEGGDADGITQWGRIEQAIDRRDTTDTTELEQHRDEQLLTQAEKLDLEVIPVDTDAVSWPDGYALGDKVTVDLDGVTYQDVIREIRLVSTADDGLVVTPFVATPGRRTLRATSRQLQRLEARIAHLERST